MQSTEGRLRLGLGLVTLGGLPLVPTIRQGVCIFLLVSGRVCRQRSEKRLTVEGLGLPRTISTYFLLPKRIRN